MHIMHADDQYISPITVCYVFAGAFMSLTSYDHYHCRQIALVLMFIVNTMYGIEIKFDPISL